MTLTQKSALIEFILIVSITAVISIMSTILIKDHFFKKSYNIYYERDFTEQIRVLKTKVDELTFVKNKLEIDVDYLNEEKRSLSESVGSLRAECKQLTIELNANASKIRDQEYTISLNKRKMNEYEMKVDEIKKFISMYPDNIPTYFEVDKAAACLRFQNNMYKEENCKLNYEINKLKIEINKLNKTLNNTRQVYYANF